MNNRIQLVQKSVNLWHDRFILCCIATISGFFFFSCMWTKEGQVGSVGSLSLIYKV